MKIIKNKISIFLLLFVLIGCYSKETVDLKVLLSTLEKGRFEIEIPIHHEGRGNIHTLDISKYKFDQPHWIYLKSTRGKVNASEIILTYHKGKIEYPWIQSNLKGYIEFKNDSLSIKLLTPIYIENNTTPDKWEEYKHNGKYLIEGIN